MLKFGNLWGILPLAPEPFRFIPFKQNRETEKLKSFFFLFYKEIHCLQIIKNCLSVQV